MLLAVFAFGLLETEDTQKTETIMGTQVSIRSWRLRLRRANGP